MKMKELSALTGIPDRTIRYYISDGIFVPEKYTENYQGRKKYHFTDKDVEQLKRIAILRKYDFSIKEIKALLYEEANVQKLLNKHIVDMKSNVNSDINMINSMVNVSRENPNNADELCDMLDNPYIAGKPIPIVDHSSKFRKLYESENKANRTLRKRLLAVVLVSVFTIAFLFVLLDTSVATVEEAINQDAATGDMSPVDISIGKIETDDAILYLYWTKDNRLGFSTLKINDSRYSRYSICTVENIDMHLLSDHQEIIKTYHRQNMNFVYGVILNPQKDVYEYKGTEYKITQFNTQGMSIGAFISSDKEDGKEERTDMELLSELKNLVKDCHNIDNYLNAFEKFSQIKSPDDEEIYFYETGNYNFTGQKEFYFSVVRQYKTSDDADEYTQIHLDMIYEPIDDIKSTSVWSDEFKTNQEFFTDIKLSKAYQFISENQFTPKRVDIYIEQT